jgi:hypothetical protein
MAAAANPTAAPAPGDESGAAGNVPAATAASDDTRTGPNSTADGRGVFGGGVAVSAEPSRSAAEAPGVSTPAASMATAPEAWLLLVSLAAVVGGIGLIVIATRRG